MRLLFLLPLVLCASLFAGRAAAQADERVGVQTVWVTGARAAALGGAGVALPGDGWASLNPALLATAGAARLDLYADQGFGLSELRTGALQLTYPLSFATLAAGAQTLGFDAFRVSNGTLGAGRAFSLGTRRQVEAGAALSLHHAQVAGYGSGMGVALDAGLRVEVVPGLHAGFSGRNLTAARLAGVEPLPQVLAVGMAFAPERHVTVAADVEKDTRFPLSLRAGVEVLPVEMLALRVGVATEPSRFSAGAGLRLGPLRADLAASRHEVLGWTPAVELGVAW